MNTSHEKRTSCQAFYIWASRAELAYNIMHFMQVEFKMLKIKLLLPFKTLPWPCFRFCISRKPTKPANMIGQFVPRDWNTRESAQYGGRNCS